MKHIYIPLFAVYIFFGCTALVAEEGAQLTLVQDRAPATASDAETLQWPREYQDQAGEVVIYQPQLEEWIDHATLTARAAVSVQFEGSGEFYYGALYFKAKTEVDKEESEVLLYDFRSTKLHFPDIDEEIAAQASDLVSRVLPSTGSKIMLLERLIADLEAGNQDIHEVDVNLDPPPIFYSDQPAILLGFMGEPSFKPVDGVDGVMFAINTNWDLLLDLSTSTYYLLNDESWMKTSDPLNGPWINAGKLPGSFNSLPDNDDWGDVKQHIPGELVEELALVIVATEPSELIETDGEPEYGVVSGTKLLYISNTDSDVFYDNDDENFYFLTAGRWFRAEELQGPWYAASADLPEEFQKIPPDHKRGGVLSAVPGTPDAEAAVLLASVPQKATVSRRDTTTEIIYEGEPEFVMIQGTNPSVYYGVNSPNDVFRVSGLYYAVVDGVWFVASAPLGPWAVAVEVDEAIYSIPESSPKYNVTYVRVYDSTPDHVVVGYTSGYSGSYVAITGVLMFGLGLWASNYWGNHRYRHYHYHSHYYGYGSGARYRYGRGYYWGGRPALYGPFGGIGGMAGYNPLTRHYYRGGFARGPYGSAFARTSYNPYAIRRIARKSVKTPYASWGKSVVSKGSNWTKRGHRARRGEAISAVKGAGRGAFDGGYKRRAGKGFKASQKKQNNLFVGKDGGVYKRDGKEWSKHSGKDGWKRSKVRPDVKQRTSLKQRNRAELLKDRKAGAWGKGPKATPDVKDRTSLKKRSRSEWQKDRKAGAFGRDLKTSPDVKDGAALKKRSRSEWQRDRKAGAWGRDLKTSPDVKDGAALKKRSRSEWQRDRKAGAWGRDLKTSPDVKDGPALKKRGRSEWTKDRKAGAWGRDQKAAEGAKDRKAKMRSEKQLQQQQKRARTIQPKATSTTREQPKRDTFRGRSTQLQQPQRGIQKAKPAPRQQQRRSVQKAKPAPRQQQQRSIQKAKPAPRQQQQRSIQKAKPAPRQQQKRSVQKAKPAPRQQQQRSVQKAKPAPRQQQKRSVQRAKPAPRQQQKRSVQKAKPAPRQQSKKKCPKGKKECKER